MEIPAMWWEYI